MSTTTRDDIVNHVTRPALENSGDTYPDETIDAVTDAIIAAAPLDTWTLTNSLAYDSPAIDADQFWAIVVDVLNAA